MTRVFFCLFGVLLIAGSAAWGQEPAPATPSEPAISPPTMPLPPTTDTAVPSEQAPVAPAWTYERQMQNRQGTVTNTHRYMDVPEEGRYVREHVVTNPHGEMTQTRERVNTEEGYQYRRTQVWTNPDGSTLRQHEQSLSGTDPYNNMRESSHTLQDGRTINQSQVPSWDGTSGTIQRSFTGPNGQTRESAHRWTPDEAIAGGTVSTPDWTAQPSDVMPSSTATVPSASQPTEQTSWWRKWNPFRKRGNASASTATASAARRGFSIGTPNDNSARGSAFRSGDQPSLHASQDTPRPSWAGSSARSLRSQGPSVNANSHATALRPNSGRGPTR